MRDRPAFDLFLISWLVLFLELACIRWFPSHVLFLTFFVNLVLLACFFVAPVIVDIVLAFTDMDRTLAVLAKPSEEPAKSYISA